MQTAKTATTRTKTGAVMLEFLVCFPIVLMLILGAVQVTHLWVARVVVHYAAYCAARCAVVCQPGEYGKAADAAEQVIAWVHVGDLGGWDVPGWGALPGGQGVGSDIISVTITETPDWNIKAEVVYDFNLITPIIGPLMANLSPPELNLIPTETGDFLTPDYPKLRLTETVYMSKPFKCVMPAEWP